MKKFLFLLFFTSLSFSQNLNDYKYALVASRFEFQSSKDLYRLNTLTKLFMEKYGFEAYLDSDVMPTNFANNNCDRVFVDVESKSTFLVTKVHIVIKDCKNNVIATSLEGSSREKDLKVAYDQALRKAFANFTQVTQHKYTGEKDESYQNVNIPATATVNTVTTIKQFFAQPIANGFQIIDSEPKVIYKIFKTSTKDFYIATKGTLQGVFFSKNKEWFFEFYQDDKLFSERVDVKF